MPAHPVEPGMDDRDSRLVRPREDSDDFGDHTVVNAEAGELGRPRSAQATCRKPGAGSNARVASSPQHAYRLQDVARRCRPWNANGRYLT